MVRTEVKAILMGRTQGQQDQPLRWRSLLFLLVAFLPWPVAVFAEEADRLPKPNPVVGHAVRSGVSPSVQSIEAPALRLATKPREIPLRRLRTRPGPKLAIASFDPVLQGSVGVAAMPAPAFTFDGLSNADNGFPVIPPDPNGDIGPHHYVQAVNLLFRVFDKTTGVPLTDPAPISSLFAGIGGPCEFDNGDPIVLYDPLADRWLISQLAFDTDLFGTPVPPFHQCVACSQTGDPTGAYFVYDFVVPGNWINDYPKFGVWPDAYYYTDNQFDPATEAPHGAGVAAFERAKILAGDPTAGLIFFDLEPVDPHIDGLLPADVDGEPPPIGAPGYFVCLTADDFGDPQGDGLRIFEFHADFANPANSTFAERAESTVATATFDPQLFCDTSERDCIPQPSPADATMKLDAISDRLMHRLQYRNFGSYESLVVNHTVDVGSNHAGVRYYQVRRNLPGGSFFVQEQASFAPDADHRWMGSAAMDYLGNLAVGYSVASTNTFPSIRYAGRLASDPPGGLAQGEAMLQAGAGAQLDPSSRWGDYSMLAVDPVDECTFWYVNEYYATSSDQGWQTRIGKFKFPGSTPASKGILQGTVTDAVSSLPISNALVRTASGYSRATDTNGFYSMTLPAGMFQVTASALNHGSSTAPGVNVSNGSTNTQNFALAPVGVLKFSSFLLDDSSGNTNGAIDVNECVHLGIVLTNTGAATASNVFTVLSSATPGVMIHQPGSVWPIVAVGQTTTNFTPFQFSTSPAFVCGTPIQFALTATHGMETNAISLKLNTGSVIGSPARFDTNTVEDIFPFSATESPIDVTGIVGPISKVTVSLHISYPNDEDLIISLIGPDNTTVTLSQLNPGQNYGAACSPDGSRTTFDDDAVTNIVQGTDPYVGA